MRIDLLQHGATRRCLRDAAIDFSLAIEAEDEAAIKRAWDRLRKAALRYTTNPRQEGRPRNDG